MALRKILTEGDEQLLKHSRKVEKFDDRLHTLIDDMRETLENSGGVGLAAPQVGILRRVVVLLDVNKEPEEMVELVNPSYRAERLRARCRGLPVRAGRLRLCDPSDLGEDSRTGPFWQLVRARRRGHCSAVLLPRDRASGRSSVHREGRGVYRPGGNAGW